MDKIKAGSALITVATGTEELASLTQTFTLLGAAGDCGAIVIINIGHFLWVGFRFTAIPIISLAFWSITFKRSI